MQRIGIIGHFGGQENFTDGQTVKVRALYDGLNRFSNGNFIIDKVDTYYLRRNPLKLFASLLKCIIFDKRIIFLPATNGRRILFKSLYYVSKIFRKEIYHDCIGGALVKELKERPKWIKYLNSFKSNWMESDIQAKMLREMGVRNASFLPNFKHIDPLDKSELSYTDPVFRFCTFSRVLPEKGIGDAIDAITTINEAAGTEIAHLDIYGPIQNTAKEWFSKTVQNAKYTTYCGIIAPEDSVRTIKNYYMLLFPTRYFTEGMPGTIIDAMFAGLPVISRRWVYCDEMITDGYNGLVYDFDKPEQLKDKIQFAINNQELVNTMKINCIDEAQRYSEKEVVTRIIKDMGI